MVINILLIFLHTILTHNSKKGRGTQRKSGISMNQESCGVPEDCRSGGQGKRFLFESHGKKSAILFFLGTLQEIIKSHAIVKRS